MKVPAKVIPGYGVASGKSNDPRFQGGTIRMQMAHFKERGLDLSPYFPGTLNIDISPASFEIIKPKHTFDQIDWSEYISPENFFFFDIKLYFRNQVYQGLVYMPDPATKEQHIQQPTTLELILPKIERLEYGADIEIEMSDDQMKIG